MHIAWVNERAAPVGGCERYVQDTVALLSSVEVRAGANPVRSTLLYGVDGWTEPAFVDGFDAAFPVVDLERQLTDINPDVVYVHRAPRDWLAVLARVRVPRVVFFHDHRLFCLREHKYTVIGKRTCTRPVGAHCYPCGGFVHRRDGRLGLRSLGGLRAEQALVKQFDRFVVGSRYMAGHIHAHGFDRTRTLVAPLFVHSDVASSIDDVHGSGASNPFDRSPNTVVFAGQLVTGKGLDVLLHALVRMHHHVRVTVLGDGPQRDSLIALSRSLGVAGRVMFRGRVPAVDVRLAMRTATCVVVPSRAPETFALVGPEALAVGTPVVATEVGGTGEWLTHDVTGLAVPAGDADALARALDRVIDEPDAARARARTGQQWVREQLAPVRHIERLMAMFDGLCTHRSHR